MTSTLVSLARSLVRRRNVSAGLCGLVIGCTFGYGVITWGNRSAPVIVHDEHEIGSHAVVNGHIDLYFNLDRTRDCPAETSHWLWTWVANGEDRVKLFYPLTNNATTLTDVGKGQKFILSIPVPRGIWPGQWFYWSKSIEHCSLLQGLFRSAVRESRDIPIRIVTENP